MLEFLSKKKVIELEHKIKLCESFIEKEIDVEFYTQEKQNAEFVAKQLKAKSKVFLTFGAGGALILLFALLFFLVYYTLKQLL